MAVLRLRHISEGLRDARLLGVGCGRGSDAGSFGCSIFSGWWHVFVVSSVKRMLEQTMHVSKY